MNRKTFLVITSIASPNEVLTTYAARCKEVGVKFVLVGDTKSPEKFSVSGCDFWSMDRQRELDFKLAEKLPESHYARKNIGYLLAIGSGAEVIIETDDDNFPKNEFWDERKMRNEAHLLVDRGWVNIYRYFSDKKIWPRGFSLEHVLDEIPDLADVTRKDVYCPIQQGLADENPDVDAIYRLIMPLPVRFAMSSNVASGKGCWCPFNSQNTTWFKAAFLLLYLPSYCSFRMTDIWRSFVAQRIAWSCGWSILFHNATVYQERNVHDLLKDFEDEIPGYLNSVKICDELSALDLVDGPENIADNLFLCYERLVRSRYIDSKELRLLKSWISDFDSCR
jgi:hypothetical protein